jgi:hypothetical protein
LLLNTWYLTLRLTKSMVTNGLICCMNSKTVKPTTAPMIVSWNFIRPTRIELATGIQLRQVNLVEVKLAFVLSTMVL